MNLKEKFLYGLVVPSALLGSSTMAAMDHEEIARSVRNLGAQQPTASAVTPASSAAAAAADAAVAAHRRREAERAIERVARKSPHYRVETEAPRAESVEDEDDEAGDVPDTWTGGRGSGSRIPTFRSAEERQRRNPPVHRRDKKKSRSLRSALERRAASSSGSEEDVVEVPGGFGTPGTSGASVTIGTPGQQQSIDLAALVSRFLLGPSAPPPFSAATPAPTPTHAPAHAPAPVPASRGSETVDFLCMKIIDLETSLRALTARHAEQTKELVAALAEHEQTQKSDLDARFSILSTQQSAQPTVVAALVEDRVHRHSAELDAKLGMAARKQDVTEAQASLSQRMDQLGGSIALVRAAQADQQTALDAKLRELAHAQRLEDLITSHRAQRQATDRIIASLDQLKEQLSRPAVETHSAYEGRLEELVRAQRGQQVLLEQLMGRLSKSAEVVHSSD